MTIKQTLSKLKHDKKYVFKINDLDKKVEYTIDITPKPNKHSNKSGNSLTKEEYDLLKGVLEK